ncbi:MAG: pilus assembly protein PilM, partial [Zoogloeaceae bacterium]|nr:pilus assembly protein PilM [Zoogloeaceae bacterium]
MGLNLSLNQKSLPLLGLDISASAVKLVELSATGRGYRVERYAIETLPKDAVVDGNIADLDAVQSAVRSAWKRLGSSTRNVAVALPTSAVISKKITVPTGLREDELVGLVESEASQHIPFSMDEVSLDFQVVGPASDPDEEEVLIVATKRDRVEDRVAVAEAIGLHVLLVDVESNASLAASELVLGQLSELGSSSIVALVDIGMNVLRFSVLKNGAPIYSREQAFGGNQLTQDVARRFGMGYAEAEAGKRSGTLPEEYVTDLLPQFTENLALEVARSLQFFFTTTQFSRVDRIVLAGGCAAINGIAEQVAARTQVSTVIANPFAGMQISDKIRSSVLQSDAPALLNACGLALRSFNEGINLLPYRD